MEATTLDLAATLCFSLAVIHTFVAKRWEEFSHTFRKGSMGRIFFHFLGEVEVVFGFWATIFLVFYSFYGGFALYDGEHNLVGGALHYLESQDFTEPAFVFVIMAIAGTRPIVVFTEKIIMLFARLLPMSEKMSFYVSTLILGPLLGSFITEPAAMTVTAVILLNFYYSRSMSRSFMYATLGLLFVNISVGGTLTHFAAPPVLMVAAKWDWGITHMITHFGYKAALSIVVATLGVAFLFRKELAGELSKGVRAQERKLPWWVVLVHILFMGFVVYTAHHMVFFLGLFLFFLAFHAITSRYQDAVKIKESLLVGFFLAGLVTLGTMQAWWIRPLLSELGDLPLFLGTMALTAFTDNAALTYLGSLAPLADSSKYNLVAGAVAGGGLTVIANAPNPAGFGILKRAFGPSGISPLGLLCGAIPPSLLCILAFQLL